MIGIRAPAERRAGIMGVTSTALMLGNLTGPLIGGAVAGSFGLRSVFFLATAVLAVLVVSLYPRMVEPTREEPRSGPEVWEGERQREEPVDAATGSGALPS